MRVLFVGDVFGSLGRRILASYLSAMITEHAIDVCIANGENVAGGRGITKQLARKLHKYGVQIITGGNHSFVHPEVYSDSAQINHLLRPLNLSDKNGGSGVDLFTLADGRVLGTINLIGRTFINENFADPFKIALEAIQTMQEQTKNIIIDFHAEASSEKICLAHYLDGSISALLGTHTHVQTADERILPKGTAFITDVGMTGAQDSAIGMTFESVLVRYLSQDKTSFEQSLKGPMFNGVIIDIDESCGMTRSITRIYRRYT
ncbi:MAG: YmdB family metallophosphoesterase [Chitinivibrionales bacterium]|nr:YmdB family metallophosphoesterase [Chitinivibrionales bacterium]